ncbi:unnamed protein product [Callosobruchus maculatus]|uniref:K Homology domain-containing protein n=1 Tax=Callosobruchus maculatus TaxID=64391 RepID=A0A653DW41_CALMS|nr:unnamed protein product [Callosobruchus maculatus]
MAADTGMDTCPSPENADSRKRPLDGDNDNDADKKRSHFSSDGESDEDKPMATGSGGDGNHHFKVLVPSVAAGAIIGKGGETIAQLQKETGARVKMSKSHDFYPGTSERVCLITGSSEAIMAVMDFIMDKIREKPDLSKAVFDADSKSNNEREKQVKILVPNSTAGMIIGKAGNYIKQIKEQSGSYVQISQKSKEVSLQERCITVIGDKEQNKKACMMILAKVVEDPQSGTCLIVSYADVSGPVANFNPNGSPFEQNKKACMMILAKVVEDPQSGTCLNVSYADVSGPVANFNPTGSPFAQNPQNPAAAAAAAAAFGGAAAGLTAAQQSLALNGAAAAAAAAAGLQISLNLTAPGGQSITGLAQLLDHMKVQLRNTGYADSQIVEVCQAITVLVKYGIIGIGLGLSSGHHAGLPVQTLQRPEPPWNGTSLRSTRSDTRRPRQPPPSP